MSRDARGPLQPAIWSLWEMLEIKALPFLSAVTEMRTLIVTIGGFDFNEQVAEEARAGVLSTHAGKLADELEKLSARSAIAVANRLKQRLQDASNPITYGGVQNMLIDIESRFADHLSDIRLLVLSPNEVGLMGTADEMLSTPERSSEGFPLAYPKAAFEIEESAKCIALGRFTASAFHSMRALECGIKAMARYLGIPDPTKPAERNWGHILGEIKKAINDKWPPGSRVAGSDGANAERLYVTLDAVKNPWRNSTMHVETIYAPHEALHILRCVCVFMLDLSQLCDEQGRTLSDAPAMTAVEEAAPKEGGEAA